MPVCFIRCQQLQFAGQPTSSSNTFWFEQRKWSRMCHCHRLRLTTINLQSNLYTLFYRKIHQKSWAKYQAPVSTPPTHHRPYPTLGNCRQCQTVSSMLTPCTKIIVQHIWQTSEPTHNFTIFSCSKFNRNLTLSFVLFGSFQKSSINCWSGSCYSNFNSLIL